MKSLKYRYGFVYGGTPPLAVSRAVHEQLISLIDNRPRIELVALLQDEIQQLTDQNHRNVKEIS
jgi:hypothetical protein